MKYRAIKHNNYLLTVSREHHFGLLFCWKIRRGLELKIDMLRIVKYAEMFWRNYLQPHFTEEEKMLLVDSSDILVKQALEEHRQFTEKIKQILEAGEKTTALEFFLLADMLTRHIRFEERGLFPHLQHILNPLQLAYIENYLEKTNKITLKDTYGDEFWKDPGASL